MYLISNWVNSLQKKKKKGQKEEKVELFSNLDFIWRETELLI